MQNLLRIGTGLAFVLAIVSVHLWRELRAERTVTAELIAQMGESAQAPTSKREASPAATAATAPARNAAGTEPATQPQAPNGNVNVVPSNAFNVQGNGMLQDPEYHKALLTQARMQLKRIYTDVAEELGLTEAEVEQLFNLLAERQVGANIPLSVGPDGTVDQQSMEQATRLRRDAQRTQEEAIQALLGPARQPKWQEYQLSISARSRATQMSGMLAASGHPLTETQLRPLTKALIAEEKYVRDTQGTSRSQPMNAESAVRAQEESIDRQEESNRRYLEVAAAHMTARQLSLVKEVLEQQIAMSRATARMRRERMQSARPTVAVEPAVINYAN